MAFKKATAEQAALKISMYGKPGSGKTLTALLVAEGLAKHSGKRIAFVDTETGTAFYSREVPARKIHPQAFDFDALYTRQLTEVLKEIKALKPSEYGVIVIDSITHLWETAKASYTGPKTKAGTLPMHAWGKIKAPYKELMTVLLNSSMHVLILGREGNEFAEDDATGEIKAAGTKMKAEGETAYEPHVCLHMEAFKDQKSKSQIITAFAEKDRSGVLSGRYIEWPNFDNLAAPLLGLLGHTQFQLQSEDEAALADGEVIAAADRKKETNSRSIRHQFESRFRLAKSLGEVDGIGKEVPDSKRSLLPEDLEAVRTAYAAARGRLSNGKPAMPTFTPDAIDSEAARLGWNEPDLVEFLAQYGDYAAPKDLPRQTGEQVLADLRAMPTPAKEGVTA